MRRYAWAPNEPQLDVGQMDTLDLLVQHGAWTMHEFAMALCIEPSTATRAIARLVDAGLADRSTHPSDKRMTVVRATQDGRAVQKRLALRRLAAVVEALEGFDSGDRRRLADLLERFIAGLDEVVLVRSSTCLPHRQTSSKPLYPSAAHVRHDSA
jgi:DNA-binding MarR family transcriptional regulator